MHSGPVAPIWRVAGEGHGQPAVDGRLAVFLTRRHEVVAVDREAGEAAVAGDDRRAGGRAPRLVRGPRRRACDSGRLLRHCAGCAHGCAAMAVRAFGWLWAWPLSRKRWWRSPVCWFPIGTFVCRVDGRRAPGLVRAGGEREQDNRVRSRRPRRPGGCRVHDVHVAADRRARRCRPGHGHHPVADHVSTRRSGRDGIWGRARVHERHGDRHERERIHLRLRSCDRPHAMAAVRGHAGGQPAATQGLGAHWPSPGRTLLAGSASGLLTAIDLRSGRVQWTYAHPLGGSIGMDRGRRADGLRATPRRAARGGRRPQRADALGNRRIWTMGSVGRRPLWMGRLTVSRVPGRSLPSDRVRGLSRCGSDSAEYSWGYWPAQPMVLPPAWRCGAAAVVLLALSGVLACGGSPQRRGAPAVAAGASVRDDYRLHLLERPGVSPVHAGWPAADGTSVETLVNLVKEGDEVGRAGGDAAGDDPDSFARHGPLTPRALVTPCRGRLPGWPRTSTPARDTTAMDSSACRHRAPAAPRISRADRLAGFAARGGPRDGTVPVLRQRRRHGHVHRNSGQHAAASDLTPARAAGRDRSNSENVGGCCRGPFPQARKWRTVCPIRQC